MAGVTGIRKLSGQRRAEIIRSYRGQYSIKQLIPKLGWSRGTISRVVRKFNLQLPHDQRNASIVRPAPTPLAAAAQVLQAEIANAKEEASWAPPVQVRATHMVRPRQCP
jgi:transposase